MKDRLTLKKWKAQIFENLELGSLIVRLTELQVAVSDSKHVPGIQSFCQKTLPAIKKNASRYHFCILENEPWKCLAPINPGVANSGHLRVKRSLNWEPPHPLLLPTAYWEPWLEQFFRSGKFSPKKLMTVLELRKFRTWRNYVF